MQWKLLNLIYEYPAYQNVESGCQMCGFRNTNPLLQLAILLQLMFYTKIVSKFISRLANTVTLLELYYYT